MLSLTFVGMVLSWNAPKLCFARQRFSKQAQIINKNTLCNDPWLTQTRHPKVSETKLCKNSVKSTAISTMKLLTLHKRNTYIRYKHTICSWAAIFVFLAAILTVILPFYIAFYLFNDIWSQYKIVYEHPDVRFQYRYTFLAEYSASSVDAESSYDSSVTTCSSYEYLNRLFEDFSDCSVIKVSTWNSIWA